MRIHKESKLKEWVRKIKNKGIFSVMIYSTLVGTSLYFNDIGVALILVGIFAHKKML